ncbi:MAG: hypothetical protein ACREB5_11135, partial [Sphingomonadaceae bacterium]
MREQGAGAGRHEVMMVRIFAPPLGASLVLGGVGAAAQTAPLSAEDALANYHEMTRIDDRPAACNRAAASDEIVVCGKDDST